MDYITNEKWARSYDDYSFRVASDCLTDWIDRFLPAPGATVFELGCHPGRYLAHLGCRGLRLSGIDVMPHVHQLDRWLRSQRMDVGRIWQGDALSYCRETSDRFDLVYSMGFIEHFDDYLTVLELHTHLVNDVGTLVVTVPNFSGAFQHRLHSWLDAENLAEHNLGSMHLEKWVDRLARLGFHCRFAGPIGGWEFWHNRTATPGGALARVADGIASLSNYFRWLPSSKLYSPYLGMVASRLKSP